MDPKTETERSDKKVEVCAQQTNGISEAEIGRAQWKRNLFPASLLGDLSFPSHSVPEAGLPLSLTREWGLVSSAISLGVCWLRWGQVPRPTTLYPLFWAYLP